MSENMSKSRTWHSQMGLTLSGYGPGKPLAWGVRHGALLHWPDWVKRLIVKVWNFFNCRLAGHAPFLGKCVNCSKSMPLTKDDQAVLDHWDDEENGEV